MGVLLLDSDPHGFLLGKLLKTRALPPLARMLDELAYARAPGAPFARFGARPAFQVETGSVLHNLVLLAPLFGRYGPESLQLERERRKPTGREERTLAYAPYGTAARARGFVKPTGE